MGQKVLILDLIAVQSPVNQVLIANPGMDDRLALGELLCGLVIFLIILLSARAGDEASIEGLTLGADDYVTKPFTPASL
jgi:DNA-binding response OmpR family regulator